MARPEKGTPEFELWIAAIEIAAHAPLKQNKSTGVTRAQIPWICIDALRSALDQLGIDWRKVKAGG